MALFPSLEPLTRTYSLGSFPITTQDYPAATVRFLHGSLSVDWSLELGYGDLTQSEGALIRNHYRTQQGAFIPFDLPSVIWAGNAVIPALIPDQLAWYYVDQPQETHKDGGLVDVTAKLVGRYI